MITPPCPMTAGPRYRPTLPARGRMHRRTAAAKGPAGAQASEVGPGASGQERLRDDLLHDLAGAAADGHEARVTGEALDGVLPHVAIASVKLHAVVGDLLEHLGREELHHRDLAD